MKYAVICDTATPQALASSTLFDLLGDPTTWEANHEVIFIGDPDGTDKGWAADICKLGGFKVQDDFEGIDDSWIILGPVEEDLVVEGTATGAKYLALNEGLVELQIEEDPQPEVPVNPDIPEDSPAEETPVETVDKPVEIIEESPVEVPATPKRRASRKKAAPKPKPDVKEEHFDKAVEEALETVNHVPDEEIAEKSVYGTYVLGGDVTKAYVEEIRTGPIPRRPESILRELINTLLNEADEDQLWQIAASIRGVVKH